MGPAAGGRPFLLFFFFPFFFFFFFLTESGGPPLLKTDTSLFCFAALKKAWEKPPDASIFRTFFLSAPLKSYRNLG